MRRLLAIVAVLAIAAAGMIGLTAVPASASVSGNCTAPYYTPSYPVRQSLDLTVNNTIGPIWVYQGSPMVKYHDANGNENFYGSYIAWVNIGNTYRDQYNWPATWGRGPITTVSSRYLGGPYILVVIPIDQAYDIGACTI